MQSQVSEFLSVWIYPWPKPGVGGCGFWSGFLGRIAVRMARNAKLSEALARFLGQAARYLVLAVAFITAASAVLETTSLVALPVLWALRLASHCKGRCRTWHRV